MSFLLCLGLLAVFFLAGVILGQVSANGNPDVIVVELHQYLTDYYTLDTNEGNAGQIFLSALLIYFRYPLLAFLLGAVVPGALLLPVVSAAFGYFLSFSVCCFARAFGETGVLIALAVLGLRCLISLPCFFVLATPALQRAVGTLCGRLLAHGKRLQKQRLGAEWWLVVCMIAAILLAGALAEVFVSPILLQTVFRNILI